MNVRPHENSIWSVYSFLLDFDEPWVFLIPHGSLEQNVGQHPSLESLVSSAPEGAEVIELPSLDSRFEEELADLASRLRARQVVLFPPTFGSRLTPTLGLPKRFSGVDLALVVIGLCLEALPQGTTLLAITFARHLSERTKSVQRAILNQANLAWLVECDAQEIGMGSLARLRSMVFQVGTANTQTLTRFFSFKTFSQSVLDDLKELSGREGGRTQYGYILRSLDAVDDLDFDLLNPQRAENIRSLEHWGGLEPLEQVCDILNGTFYRKDREIRVCSEQQIKPDSDEAWIIEGQQVNAGLGITHGALLVKRKASDRLLEVGDLCLSRINSGSQRRLVVGEIHAEHLPAVAGKSILVLKPKVEGVRRTFLIRYLSSQIFRELIGNGGSTLLRLESGVLAKLPVPVPNSAFIANLEKVKHARDYFGAQLHEADEAIDDMLRFQTFGKPTEDISAAGRDVRLRYEAAIRIDDAGYRIRSTFPHPLAFRWRTVEASKPDLNGFKAILETAEITICYAAIVGMVMAEHLELEIARVGEVAARLGRRKNGTTFGDWYGILQELGSSKKFAVLPEDTPFSEILSFMAPNTAVESATLRLMALRCDDAHLSGPKGSKNLERVYVSAREDLLTILRSLEFLSEYRLRYIEDVWVDTRRGSQRVQYRDLVGDHPFVRIEEEVRPTDGGLLEKGSVYLRDTQGRLHLVRPLLVRRECRCCGAWATFFLHRYDFKDDSCVLKSLEHGHNFDDESIAEDFRFAGLLPRSAGRS